MVIGETGSAAAGTLQSGQDEATIELRLRHLEVQLQQVESDQTLSEEERETREKTLEGRIDQLERQAEATSSAQSVSGTQTAATETTAVPSVRTTTPRFDTFSARETEPSAGLYKLTRDESGEVSVELD